MTEEYEEMENCNEEEEPKEIETEQGELEVIPNKSIDFKKGQTYQFETQKVRSSTLENHSFYESKECTQKRRNYGISTRRYKSITKVPETRTTKILNQKLNVIERPTSIKKINKVSKQYVLPAEPKFKKKVIKRTLIKKENLPLRNEYLNDARKSQNLRQSKKKTYTTSTSTKFRGSKINVKTTVHEDTEKIIQTKTVHTVKDPKSFSRHNYSYFESSTLKPKVQRTVIEKPKPKPQPKFLPRGSNYMFYDCNTGYVTEKRHERAIDKINK